MMMRSEDNSVSAKSLFSWAMYDWANSAFFAVIQTFVFATYFMRSIAVDDASGSAQWGNTISLAGLIIALLGPVLGAIADQTGRRKPWIAAFSFLCIIATALLWFVEPSENFLILALALVFLGTIGSECAIIFYNAMLPHLADNERMGRWSGWAWGLGYAGGLSCLVVALFVFIQNDRPPFGLNISQAEHVRASFVLVGVWYLVFSIPLFLYTPDRSRTGTSYLIAIKNGYRQIRQSLRNIKSYSEIIRFLIARMFFIDGLATVFAFGGIYAAGTFEMAEREVLIFGIGLNITAGIGAVIFAWMDDKVGSKKTILASLIGLIITTATVLLVKTSFWFLVTGLILGIFVGPAQAASRTYMARIAPGEFRNQMFGLFALSGKVTAFLGPLLVGWLTYFADSQRIGMSVIILFFVVGFLLMLTVPEVSSSGERS